MKTYHGTLIWTSLRRYGTELWIGHASGRPRLVRKFYRYLDAHVAQEEYASARWLFEEGLPTPRPIRLVRHETMSDGIEFAWVALEDFSTRDAARGAQDLHALVRRLHACPPRDGCRSWPTLVATEYGPEIERALAWCHAHGEEGTACVLAHARAAFDALVADGLVHGDLSPDNVGYCGDVLYCLDLRHFGAGPANWDIGYFLAHLEPADAMARSILAAGAGDQLLALAVAACAVKLGRRLRRGDDPTIGCLRLRAWARAAAATGATAAGAAFAAPLPSGSGMLAIGSGLLRHGLLEQAGRIFTALAATALPERQAAALNRAVVLHASGDFAQARASYEQLLAEVEPRHEARLCKNLGILHLQMRDRARSRSWLDRAAAHAPGQLAVAVTALAWHHSFRSHEAGIAAYERMRAANPGHALTAVMSNTGANLYAAAGRGSAARAAWDHALAHDPEYWNAATNKALACAGLLPDAEVLRHALDGFSRRTECFPPRQDGAVPARASAPAGFVRVGIVSSRIRRGKTGYLLRALLRWLDRSRCAIVVYDNAVAEDRFAAPLVAAADSWVAVFGWSATRLARRIRTDAVDVLLDLDGHGPRNFALAYWMRPSPVQLGWEPLPMPGVLDAIPVSRHVLDGFHALDEAVPLVHAPPEGGLRLACIADAEKLCPATLAVLCRLLERMPAATLTLKSLDVDDDMLRARFAAWFGERGIGVGRIRFVGFIKGHRRHLAFHEEIDVAIDPVGRSSRIAMYEALQHGVPVFALGRGSGLLRRLGLPCFVAADEDALAALCAAAADARVMARWRAAARDAMHRHQAGLAQDGKRLGDIIHALHAAAGPAPALPALGRHARHEIESIEADGSFLLLNSCFGDHVLLSVFA